MNRITLRLSFFAAVALAMSFARVYPQTASSGPWPGVSASSTLPLGVNLEGIADWMHSPMFVDAIKTSRPFGQPDQPWVDSGKMHVDANGWPLEDAGSVIMSQVPNMGGDYHLSCIGKAEVVPVASNAQVTNVHYDSQLNKTTADIIVAPSSTQLMLSFTKTSGGVKDIRLIRPGYPADSKQLFTNEFIAAIKPFTVLRYMDYADTNGNPTVNWADRCEPTDAQYTLGKGGPWEDAIALANQTGKEMWVNIPEEASDDYIRQMAALFKKELLPGRIVYIENSNEVWNWSFQQATRNQQEAEKEAADPKSTLRVDTGVQWDDPNNKWYWGTKRVAERLVKISEIWQTVYGKAALNKTIRPVLASQIVNPFLLKLQVGYIAKVVGPPRDYVYAVAGAPYFGLDDAMVKNTNASVDDVLDNLSGAVDTNVNKVIPPVVAIAKQYGLNCFAYEGGPDVGQSTASLDAKIAANRSPKMTDLLVTYLKGWYADGGSLFMYFDLSSAYGQWGCWGLMDDVSKPSVKTEAITKILKLNLNAGQ
jgi:hypothetical protein